MSEPVIHVAGLCGSLRHALRGAAEAGAQTQLIDLRDYTLAFCDGKESESSYPEPTASSSVRPSITAASAAF